MSLAFLVLLLVSVRHLLQDSVPAKALYRMYSTDLHEHCFKDG